MRECAAEAQITLPRKPYLGLRPTEWAMAATSVALNTLLHRSLPPRFHVPASLAACATVSALAAKSGAGLDEQGLSLSRLPRGCLYGLAAAAPIVAALGAGLYFERTRTFYRADHIAGSTTGPVAYEALFRIPLGTALSEEVIFRGALLGVLSRYHREPVPTAISSLLFGLWHIAPTLSQIDTVSEKPPVPKAALVARSVGITAVAGLVLAWLRYRSGSIAAPWIAHGAANATGYLGVRLAARLTSRKAACRLRGS